MNVATQNSQAGRRIQLLVSHQGCIPIYRKSFFVRLNQNSSVEYVVIHGNRPRGTDLLQAKPPFDFPNIEVHNHEVVIGGQSFIWQPIVFRALFGEFDGAVIGDEVKYLSNVVVAMLLRLRGRPVILWGFGFHQYAEERSTWRARLAEAVGRRLKAMLYRLASGYLAYTEGGAQALRANRIAPPRVAVLWNTVDMERERSLQDLAAQRSLEDICRTLGVREHSAKLLFLGRLIPTKKIDYLIEYARRCESAGRLVDILIFGSGVDDCRLKQLASSLTSVSFFEHDDLLLAQALRVSAALVIPGYMGLAITHAFAHGVPVITCTNPFHSPEIEYLRDGENGLMLPDSFGDFVRGLDDFLDDATRQVALRKGAEATGKTIDMTIMVSTFRNFCEDILGLRGRGL